MTALPDHLLELAARVSNRGRWGADDRRGTLNLIDEEAVRRGAAAVRQGRPFSLAVPFDADGPQTGAIPGRTNPELEMTAINVEYTGSPDGFTTNDDRFQMGVQACTHWDALSHVGYSGELYNGTPDTVVTEAGAAKLGIEHMGPVVTRGILLDIARLHGVDFFEDNHPITGDELDQACAAAGVTPEAGDIVLVRTGHMHFLRQNSSKEAKDRFRITCPGLSSRSIEWFHDHHVAGVATDTLVLECFPCEDPAVLLPVHMIQLRDMGLAQGQMWALDELAADCAADGRWDCMVTCKPLFVVGGVGSPANAIAIK